MTGTMESKGRHLWSCFAATLLLATWMLSEMARGGESIAETTPARLLDEARQAAISGDTARHFALLREVVSIDPNNALARWQLGQVHVGDEWVAIEDAQRTAAADPKQTVYRQLRNQHREGPASQLALARWCRDNDLEEEARFHWASVLAVDPNHREAIRALGLRRSEGQWATHEEIDEATAERIDSRRATRQWKSKVAKWQRILSREHEDDYSATLDEIRAISDPAAIPSMETVTLASEAESKPGPTGRERLSLAFITALETMDDHAATESLVRHAVLSPILAVREAAADGLRDRPLHDFVPILLEGLAMPVESSFHVVTETDGSVHYLHTLYREGSQNDWSHQITRAAFLRANNRQIAARLTNDVSAGTLAANVRDAGRGVANMASFVSQFGREAAAAEQEVALMNQSAAALNNRILPVLKEVTGEDLGDEARAWWDWWTDENGYYQAERAVYETNDSTYAEYTPPPPTPPGSCECFVAGTPVWTKTGQQPIESLELGELVLAQDVNTGELAYKPLLGRTVRPPSPLLRLSFDGEQIRTTRGHPFWVAGVGWRMAKELGDGAVLHAVTGCTRINGVKESEYAEAYNLIVADFNTYFVGESGVLVHDNTPRRPTRASVPGLTANIK